MKEKQVDYYKKRIEEFSNYTDEQNYVYYTASGLAIIANGYPNEFERDVYECLARLLVGKSFVSAKSDEIVERLSSHGRLYSAKMLKKNEQAFYHLTSANILVYSMFSKLDRKIVHELIHKLGYMTFDQEFYDMPEILIESGTEIVTNKILNQPVCRENIEGDFWGRCVGVQPAYFLESFFVTQLNKVVGNELLEKSIVDGKNDIEPEMIRLFGKENYTYFLEKIKDACMLEKKLGLIFYCKDKKAFLEQLNMLQNEILEIGFDAKYDRIQTKDEAEKYLEELMLFSDYRLKCREKDWKDDFFYEYYDGKAKELTNKYKFSSKVEDIQESWFDRIPCIMMDENEQDFYAKNKKRVDELIAKSKKSRKKFLSLPKKKKIPELGQNNSLYRVSAEELKKMKSDIKNPILKENDNER